MNTRWSERRHAITESDDQTISSLRKKYHNKYECYRDSDGTWYAAVTSSLQQNNRCLQLHGTWIICDFIHCARHQYRNVLRSSLCFRLQTTMRVTGSRGSPCSLTSIRMSFAHSERSSTLWYVNDAILLLLNVHTFNSSFVLFPVASSVTLRKWRMHWCFRRAGSSRKRSDPMTSRMWSSSTRPVTSTCWVGSRPLGRGELLIIGPQCTPVFV